MCIVVDQSFVLSPICAFLGAIAKRIMWKRRLDTIGICTILCGCSVSVCLVVDLCVLFPIYAFLHAIVKRMMWKRRPSNIGI